MIYVKVSTPQFNPDGTIRFFMNQHGFFNTETFVFHGNNHQVFFKSIDDLNKHCLKVYEYIKF